MGAIVASTYALNPDWYSVLRNADLAGMPSAATLDSRGNGGVRRAREILSFGLMLRDLALHWGIAEHALRQGRVLLKQWTLNGWIEDARIPLAVCATDLRSGTRVVLREGRAANAAYASAALAGVIPPAPWGSQLLADGAYTDVAPIDVARAFGHPLVIAVDPGQPGGGAEPHNGLQTLVRAMEICHSQHAELRFAQADLVLRPGFRRPVDTLDFSARAECIAAGVRVVRRERERLDGMLRTPPQTRAGDHQPTDQGGAPARAG
jgi:NTE family protein